MPGRCRFRESNGPTVVGLLAVAVLCGPWPAGRGDEAAATDPVAAYLGKIRPLLAARCQACHGGLDQQAGLRLDTAALMAKGGESGPAVAKGDPDTSLILVRVGDPDPASRMPPEGEGEPLTAEEIATLRAWISAGCPAPADEKPEPDPREHWAFQPRVRPAVPSLPDAAGVRNPIDAFLAGARAEAGVVPQPEAPPHVLVRRLFIDLIGLPPQPEELAAILADPAADWYERLIDRLLADPRHGERWARHWMDVWRYSEPFGLNEEHRNSQRHIWHFRDWIVESLNADLPYDEMLRQMLAADELHPTDPDKLRATGFLARNWFSFNRTRWLDETVEHVGKGLLGLTLNCAKCHAHKYDPIPQQDYYRVRAFFEPIETRLDIVAEQPDLAKDGIPRVFDAHLDRPTHLFIRGEDSKPDTSRAIEPGVPEVLACGDLRIEPITLPQAAFEPERQPWVLEAHVAAAARAEAAAAVAAATAMERHRAAVAALAKSISAGSAPDAAVAAEGTAARALATAEAAHASERARAEAVAKRAAAMRAAWEAEDKPTPEAAARRQEAARAAVQAEREVVVAEARRKLVEAEGKVAVAKPEAREKVEKEVAAARTAVEKAEHAAAEPGEAFTRFVGAKWTATRFKESRTDDPAVAFPATSTGRRTVLARWITDPHHPLTARVAANHIWMRHMGAPLVATVFDFGRKGSEPVHPSLLDWLASELVEGAPTGPAGGQAGWSMKHLHRLICTSAAYRMSSSAKGADAAMQIDPDNRFLWRRPPIRLEAQVIRDAILSLAGTLDPTMGGPPVPPAAQAASRRRSLYFWHSEVSGNPFLATFDDAPPRECYERDQSIVPQQALALANAAVVHDAAGQIATRLKAAADEAALIDSAFTMIVTRPPTAEERAACEAALAKWRAAAPAAADAMRAHLVWALFNHNDFVTLR